MAAAIISIYDKWWQKIKSGDKTIEVRKTIFRNENFDGTVYIYVTAPIKRVVGKFECGLVNVYGIDELWHIRQEEHGMTIKEYREYSYGVDHLYAIEIEDLEIFDKPLMFTDVIPGGHPTPGYQYFDPREVGA